MTQDRPSLRIATLTGQAIKPLLPDLARLRIAVFRDWPYLYDGSEAYESNYLEAYVESPAAAVIVAFAGDTPVGASTCIRLADETENVRAPFLARGYAPERFFYFGESVLLAAYRGQGAGVAFFEQREAHARRASSCDYAAFCAVIRPPDHPLRPSNHVPLDAFWRRRGYTSYPDLTCTMSWRDIDTERETEKALSFWIKSLTGAALP